MKPAPPVTSMRIAGNLRVRFAEAAIPPGSHRCGGLSSAHDGNRAPWRPVTPPVLAGSEGKERWSAGAAAQRPVGPAGGLPRVAVEGVAPVEHGLAADHLAELDRVQLPVLLPLGEHQDGVGPLGRLLRCGREVQVRPLPLAVGDRGGVRHPHDRTLQLQLGGDVEGRGGADVVSVGLCRGAATWRAGESRMSSLSGLKAAPRTATRLPTSEPSRTSRASSTMRIRRRMLMLSTSLRKVRAWSAPSSPARAMKARMSLGRQPPPKPSPALRNLRPMRP